MPSNVHDSNNITVYGEAVVSGGLEVRDGVSGYGLVTRGFIYELYNIWLDIQAAAPITTTWANSNSSITTTWTPSSQGLFGDYPP